MFSKPVLEHTLQGDELIGKYLAVAPGSAAGKGAVAGDNTRNLGIASIGARAAGDDVAVTMLGIDQARLGGQVSYGTLLKSEVGGKLVAIATTGTTLQNVTAMALDDGVEDDIIPVFVFPAVVRPALV